MNIQSVTAQQHQVNFKSAFPVVYWVKNSGGKYDPAVTPEISEKLQRKLVNALNKQLPNKNNNKETVISKIKRHMACVDPSYRYNSKVRSFYAKQEENSVPEEFAYMITGNDVGIFENLFVKDIGKTKHRTRRVLGIPRSAETMETVHRYYVSGLNFIRHQLSHLFGDDGIPLALHVKYDPIRNKKNEIKDYELIAAEFCPAAGPNSPLNRYKQLHSADNLKNNLNFK